ncbi:NAD-binding protein [Rubellimicrobium roseum]|uniref:Trk system potassium uptake protein TrkA n=1 Tax=Rubellimicrobium roseum TaxID=687525 RepID=A0A5C4N9U1_9RHOB|nr:NAD-binding protein [Rubellimicrobium roseum]TNC67505.1 hypothetical protein FHG71_15485 [Rubellimicrobium roseum]
MQRLRTPGAFDVVALADRRVQLLGIHCNTETCSASGHGIRDLPGRFLDAHVVVLALAREGRAFVPTGDDIIERGDDVFVVTTPGALAGFMDAFGHKEQIAHRIVIVGGGGNVGLNLAQQIRRRFGVASLKVIEASRPRAEFIARELGSSVVILQGNALDREVLGEANVGDAETLVAVTSDDETNLFASLLAKRRGCERTITPGLNLWQAFRITPLSWTAVALFGALPLFLSDHSQFERNANNAVVEAMSGLTTTGATILVGLDHAPPGILLWCALLQWMGGIEIIAVALAILPTLGVSGWQLLRTESSDRSEKVMPKVKQIALAIFGVYVRLPCFTRRATASSG